MPAKKKEHLVIPLLAELIPRGDGTFILKPRVPDGELDTWITVREAAQILGNIDRRVIHHWLGDFLVYCRPMPRKPKISLKSALRMRTGILDPEFWRNADLQARVKQRVQETMNQFAQDAAEMDREPERGETRGDQP